MSNYTLTPFPPFPVGSLNLRWIVLGLILFVFRPVGFGQTVVYQPYTISTIAGQNGVNGTADGIGAQARFTTTTGMAFDRDGNLIVCDYSLLSSSIRKVTPSGATTTVFGPTPAGILDGPVAIARFQMPEHIAVDSSNTIYISDGAAWTIRRISTSGVVSTLAGSTLMEGTADGEGSAARFRSPRGIVIDSSGNLFVADELSHTIRKITPSGRVTTFAGLAGVAGTANGPGNTARFNQPYGLAIDHQDNLYVGDRNNHLIRKIAPDGTTSTFAGRAGVFFPYTDGSAAVATIPFPIRIAVDRSGAVFVTSSSYGTIRKVMPDGSVTTVAGEVNRTIPLGTDGTGAGASFLGLGGLLVAEDGRLYVSDRLMIRSGVIAATPPVITAQPTGQTVQSGSSATFSVLATGTEPLSYQWRRNGTAIAGASSPTLILPNVQTSDAGVYSVVVTNSAGSATSLGAALSVTPAVSSRISNVSVRTRLNGGQTLIVGFSMVGGPKPTLLRAVGPGLSPFGVPGVMVDPRMSLFSGSTLIASNDNWSASSTLVEAAASVGAFALSNGSLDAVVLAPVEGSRTVHVSGPNGGTVLMEAYDAGVGTNPRLVNISARNYVGVGGDVLISGFTITGTSPKTVLIRAAGPTLALLGVPGVLADPKLEVFQGSTKIAENDTWGTDLAATFSAVGAFPFNVGSKDAAIVVTLAPAGGYTVQVSGSDGGTGEALIEVYEVSP